MKDTAQTVVYIIVCDNHGDKYVYQTSSYDDNIQVFHDREEVRIQRNMLEYDYPHNKYYIKDITL